MYVTETPIGGGTGFLDDDVEADRRSRRMEGLGRALLGALLDGCLQHDVAITSGARATRLVLDGDRVVGVELDAPEGPGRVAATGGVVIATGGFEWDRDLVRDFLRGPMRHPAGVPSNSGDGLRMAMRVGAQLGAMREAWWVPVVVIPGQDNYGEQGVQLVLRERTLPRSILVNRRGRRFTNGPRLHALVVAFHQSTRPLSSTRPAAGWSFDQGWVDRTAASASRRAGHARLDHQAPDLESSRHIASARALRETVDRWNALVVRDDEDFGRLRSASTLVLRPAF